MDYDMLLNYPWKRFMFLNRQIDRIQAEEDLRQIQLLISAGSAEGYEKIVERLQNQMGSIIVMETPSAKTLNLDNDDLDPEFDREGLHALLGRAPPPRDKQVETEG